MERQASLSITNSQSLLKTHVHRVDDAIHLILCHPLLLLPSVFPSIRVFSNESVLHIKWPKYWSFSISNWIYKVLKIGYENLLFVNVGTDGWAKRLESNQNGIEVIAEWIMDGSSVHVCVCLCLSKFYKCYM